METRGKKVLEKALGSFGYKRMINELRKNVYTEADHHDLARHLNLLHFYAEITKLEFVGFKEIPEVLLLRWAEDNELMVDKQLLAGLFRRTRNMRRVAGLFEYANLPGRALLSCCSSKTTSPVSLSPSNDSHRFLFEDPRISGEPEQSPPYIHLNLSNGRKTAEKLMENCPDGTYLVRTSSNNRDYAISLKMNNKVEHILVESVLTGVGQQVTVNKEKYFSGMKDLLDFYHVQNIYHTYKLDSIILPQPTPSVRAVMSPVFVGKFCQEMEERGEAVLHDVAAAFNLAEELRIFRCGFEGTHCNTKELAKWLLTSWNTKYQDTMSPALFESSICQVEDGYKMSRKLRPFFSPW